MTHKKGSNNTRGKEIVNEINKVEFKTENQKIFSDLIKNNEITIGAGFAGSGKTFLACNAALNLLKKENFQRIVLIKSVTPLKGEEIGYVKGTIQEKMEPYVYSFMNNFYKIANSEWINRMFQDQTIEIVPLAYCRGVNFDNSIIIVDEAQNITLDNMKTILTRIGYNSKMIIIGDTKQIDLHKKSDNSLSTLLEKFKNVEGFGVLEFGKDDQVRNPIISVIEKILWE